MADRAYVMRAGCVLMSGAVAQGETSLTCIGRMSACNVIPRGPLSLQKYGDARQFDTVLRRGVEPQVRLLQCCAAPPVFSPRGMVFFSLYVYAVCATQMIFLLELYYLLHIGFPFFGRFIKHSEWTDAPLLANRISACANHCCFSVLSTQFVPTWKYNFFDISLYYNTLQRPLSFDQFDQAPLAWGGVNR